MVDAVSDTISETVCEAELCPPVEYSDWYFEDSTEDEAFVAVVLGVI